MRVTSLGWAIQQSPTPMWVGAPAQRTRRCAGFSRASAWRCSCITALARPRPRPWACPSARQCSAAWTAVARSRRCRASRGSRSIRWRSSGTASRCCWWPLPATRSCPGSPRSTWPNTSAPCPGAGRRLSRGAPAKRHPCSVRTAWACTHSFSRRRRTCPLRTLNILPTMRRSIGRRPTSWRPLACPQLREPPRAGFNRSAPGALGRGARGTGWGGRRTSAARRAAGTS
mmetsp:Transcript_149892/g.417638  ORF Transcript_149892/g.417638 Transcript_149892/m.417638 type:complete len:229 (-) Transcript_149892:36-722(-)